MAKQKESLLIQFKKIIDENIEKGAKTSEQLRIGIPSSFIAADGREYRLSNVTRYMRTGKNPTFLDVEKNKIVTAARANALKIQTSPNVDKWDKKTDAVKGLEAHHKRGVKMYAPFYEGLNDKQAQELTQWFVDEGVPLGDAKSNLVNLPKDLHVGEEGIHTWMKENNIQVLPDETGKGNFITIDKGKHKGKLFVKGSPGSAVRAVMPSVKHLTLNERLPAIATWLKYVQEPVDTKLAEMLWQAHESKHPIKPGNAAQIPEIAKELAEEKKLNYADYPEWQKDELIIGGNGTNGTNGIKKNGLKVNGKTILKGAAGLIAASNFLPSKVAAEEIRDEVSKGEIGDATKTYAKDLLIGHTASRSFGGLLQLAKSKLSGNIAKKVIGRQLLKKGAALATGPAAPIVMGGLLIKDAYDVANVISGDKLKIRENKNMSTDERKKAVERLKFIK